MNDFFDTSVLVAASVASHPHHARAFRTLESLKRASNHGFMSQHAVAELYAVLTAAPFQPRIHPSEAQRILEENLLPSFTIVPPDPSD